MSVAVLNLLQEINERLKRVEARQTKRVEKNAKRRKQYKDSTVRRDQGMFRLPEKNMIKYRDVRLGPLFKRWAESGLAFGREDRPEAFLTWLVHRWNCCTYLKKPITFSGSTFRVWTGTHRMSTGARDLLGYTERRNAVQLLRNDGEYVDFKNRPWFSMGWNYAVLFPVFDQMQEAPGFDELPERFRRCISLATGSFGEWEVFPGLCWDPHESRENLNRMLKKVGTDLQMMMRAVYAGLRVVGRESPVPLPRSE